MNGVGLALALLAGTSWGMLDALRKQLAATLRPAPLSALLVLGQLPLFALWVRATHTTLPDAGYWPYGLTGAMLALGASLLFLRALALAPLSTTIPLLSLTPVFSILSAWLLAHERPSPQQLAGIALVVVGALGLQRPLPGTPLARPSRTGAAMMTGVAALWALTLTVDKLALAHAAVPAHALAQSSLIVSGLLGGLALQGRLHELTPARHQIPRLLLAIAAISLATGAQLLAVQTLLVSTVEGIKRAVGIAMATLTGQILFREPLSRSKLLAIGIIALGVGVLTAATRAEG